MDVKEAQPAASQELAREAEALLRRLTGVSFAQVLTGVDGIDAVHVVAATHAEAPRLAGHVRSALLAGLATPVLPARIHVRTAQERTAPPPHGTQPLDRLHPAPTPMTGGAAETTRSDIDGGDETDTRPASELPRIVSLEMSRSDEGRVRCDVSVAFRTRILSDHAFAVDLPGAAPLAAAEATVRALAGDGLENLQLDGFRQIDIAGRSYAVVALRRTDSSVRVRSGSAPVTASPELAAAHATVAAARALL